MRRMENISFDLSGSIQRESVFRFLGCRENSPSYETMCAEYKEFLPILYEKVRPKAVMGLFTLDAGTLEGERNAHPASREKKTALLLMVTLGEGIQEEIDGYYKKEDYLSHILLNAMADTYLFEIEKNWKPRLALYCKERGYGIVQRIEADPNRHMLLQKTAMEALEAEKRLGVKMTEGFMFSPVKTVLYAFVLSKEEQEYHMDHNCADCPSYSGQGCKCEKIF